LLWATGALQPLERPVGDFMMRIPQPRSAARAPFVAVLVDDASIARVGALPWPRSLIAELVIAAQAGGANGTVVDILLPEASADAEDAELEQALHGGPCVLAAVLSPDGSWLLPIKRFGGAARAAHAQVEVSSDGVMRRISVTKQAGDVALPAISIAAARLAGWQGAITPGTSLRPDFRQSPAAIPSVSAKQVIDGSTPDGLFTDRVVFIGLAASGASDQFVVPVGSPGRPVPGVLVHASAASSIVRGGLLEPARGWLVLLAALTAAAMVQWLRTRAGSFRFAWLASAIALVAVAGLAALWATGTVLPLITLISSLAVSAAGREALESREVQRETATILAALIEQQSAVEASALPRGAGGRLRLAQRLQRQVARDRDLRRALLEGLVEGVVLWDDSGTPLLANQAANELWGTTPPLAELRAAIGGCDPESGDTGRGRASRNGRNLELEFREIGAGTLGLFRDVTAERELERHRGEMHRMVSHELKTPLASISGFGTMLERYELDRDEQLRVAGRIRGEADRLGEMVVTFLDLERLGAGMWEMERSEVDLSALAVDRCRFLDPAVREAGQEVEVSAGDGCKVLGSAELLTRLLDNLVGNAVKYSRQAGLVRVSVAASTSCIELQVRDQGPGIPEEALPHLFERFYRVPGQESSGTGLGLALVREIADWHGAVIRVESGLGRGSVFRVEFPLIDHEGEA
jgi:signal transduction histidine kinase